MRRATGARRGVAPAAALLALLALLAPLSAARAQDREPLFEELTRLAKSGPLSIGLLVQFLGDVQRDRSFDGQNGFSVANARLRLSGELDGGIGYQVQMSLVDAPAILDVSLRYRATPWLTLEGGRFKAPFSREYLTGAASLDFVNRAQVVTLLAPARQVGMQARGAMAGGRLAYAVGAFNGDRNFAEANDNTDLLTVGRLSYWPLGGPEARTGQRLELAVNAAHSRDAAVEVGDGFIPNFRGTRALVGADARWRRNRLLLAGEVIAARLDSAGGRRLRPNGWQTTGGYMTSARSQLLVRWDSFRADGVRPDQELLVAGFNLWPTAVTELQVNYVVPTDDASPARHQILVNAQFSF